MRQTLIAWLAALGLLAGCVATGVGVSSGPGGSVSAGVASTSGMGISFSSYGDFLYSGPDAAFRSNREGLREYLDGNYAAAARLFRATLRDYPGNPDAVYYLGLSLISDGSRDTGFATLGQYRDPLRMRITQEVRWWADYCEKRPDMTPQDIRRTMNKARVEGYQREREEAWENRWDR
jgi:hypothetical protein